MTAQSFTEGDWIYGVRPDGSIWISIGNRTTGPHYQWDWFATEADAQLATAAPDLYAVAEYMEDLLLRYEINHVSGEAISDAALGIVRAAIAKARGDVK